MTAARSNMVGRVSRRAHFDRAHFDPLLALAAHLESGKLGHPVFNIAVYNDATRPECGTNGCAIGECPILFPDDWTFNEDGWPTLRGMEQADTMDSGMMFFDLDDDEYAHLFIALNQSSALGGKVLSFHATAAEVAANIRAFVEKMS